MSFFLATKYPSYPKKIDHQSKILCLGSCFSEHIGALLQKHHFQCLTNPNGVVYHPVSLFQSLLEVLQDREYTLNDLHQYNELWHSWEHHSSFSHPSAAVALEYIQKKSQETRFYLKDLDVLMITLGSAYAYKHQELNRWVANCHKYPQNTFKKELLTPSLILETFDLFYAELLKVAPNVHIIFTVSPVRHYRDGSIENTRSKAVLHTSIQSLQERYPELSYFPSYEIMMDELRDYRFYESDLLHPNTSAIQYIWRALQYQLMDSSTQYTIKDLEAWNALEQHRPLHPETQSYQKFLSHKLLKKQELLKKYPYLHL